jgi:uncharacterized protein (UPF0335 family)
MTASTSNRVEDKGNKVTLHVGGNSYDLTDKQLEEAANLVALENSLTKRPKVGGIAADQLRSIVERIESLEEEKAGLASDIKDIYAESKGNGFCTKTIRKIIALRKQDAAERDEAEHLLHTYCAALGMQTSFNFGDEERS